MANTMIQSPTISVVIPTYNRAGFLPAAVASVRAQTYRCLEIVVVDDGSSDDTAQVVQAMGPDVRYVHQTNAGPSAARNHGVHVARGDWVAFLDTDDRWLPDKLEAQVRLLAGAPEVALVTSDEQMEDGTGTLLYTSNFRQKGVHRLLHLSERGVVQQAPNALLKINFISTSTVLARRALLIELQGFNRQLRFGEDMELWLRIAADHAIGCVDAAKTVRVTHDSNSTRAIEPMLQGYVELAKVIRSWARSRLPSWGEHPDGLVADSYAALGYWYFTEGRMPAARRALLDSLRERPGLRAMVYLLASWLPVSALGALRQVKSRLRSLAR